MPKTGGLGLKSRCQLDRVPSGGSKGRQNPFPRSWGHPPASVLRARHSRPRSPHSLTHALTPPRPPPAPLRTLAMTLEHWDTPASEGHLISHPHVT